jgi:hypothetical protein
MEYGSALEGAYVGVDEGTNVDGAVTYTSEQPGGNASTPIYVTELEQKSKKKYLRLLRTKKTMHHHIRISYVVNKTVNRGLSLNAYDPMLTTDLPEGLA